MHWAWESGVTAEVARGRASLDAATLRTPFLRPESVTPLAPIRRMRLFTPSGRCSVRAVRRQRAAAAWQKWTPGTSCAAAAGHAPRAECPTSSPSPAKPTRVPPTHLLSNTLLADVLLALNSVNFARAMPRRTCRRGQVSIGAPFRGRRRKIRVGRAACCGSAESLHCRLCSGAAARQRGCLRGRAATTQTDTGAGAGDS